MLKTKDEIVSASVQLVSGHVPLNPSVVADSRPHATAYTQYDTIVSSEISKYPYSFTFKILKLQNPVIPQDIELSGTYQYYNKPTQSGLKLIVVPQDLIESQYSMLLKDDTLSVPFTAIGNGLIQVPKLDQQLFLLYQDLETDASYFSPTFSQGIKYLLASEILPLYKEYRATNLMNTYQIKGGIEIEESRRLDQEQEVSLNSKKPTFDDILYGGRPDGSF